MSDVLRRETAPLGLRVITVELGGFCPLGILHSWSRFPGHQLMDVVAMVMTAMLRVENPFSLALPQEQRSPYFLKWYDGISSKYRSDIEKRYDAAMSASDASKRIIDAVEARTSGKIWVGTMAWIFRWMWPMLSTARQDKINGDLLHVEMLKAA